MTAPIFIQLFEKKAPFCLIDCRERRDFVNGHWFGSTNIPLSTLPNRLPFLCSDFGFPVHYLDWGDEASTIALQYMRDMGYNNITAHKTTPPAGPTNGFVRGEYVWSKAFGEIVSHQSDIMEVTPRQYLSEYQDAQLVDVRPASEYNRFTLPGSKNVPNSLLLENIDELRQHDRMVLVHCAGRTRSIIGAHTLQAAGYDGPFGIFKGGTQAWELNGFKREFGATQNMAACLETKKHVTAFMRRWLITSATIPPAELDDFIKSHSNQMMFDVSDDTANGDLAAYQVVKISGTNLIQQTDRSIAKYHVPIVLFDMASGCRAAFAAYWLSRMGFTVKIAIVSANSFEPSQRQENFNNLTNENLIPRWLSKGIQIYDFRPYKDYISGHVRASKWQNITSILDKKPAQEPVGIVAACAETGKMISDILTAHGWRIDSVCSWIALNPKPDCLVSATAVDDTQNPPIDQSALFAGRHFGVLKDAQDYLDWEEDLPKSIPRTIKDLWEKRLRSKTNE